MKIRKYIPFALALCIGFTLATTTSSCKVKEGCGLEDQLAAPTDKRTGELSTKKGSSGPFGQKRVSKSRKKKG